MINIQNPLGRQTNKTTGTIVRNMLLAAVSLFVNGFGVYLTIQANIGAGPWDVLNIGLSRTLGILYGTASIGVSCSILLIDILLREPIGISMFIDAVVVGKSVDFFNRINAVPPRGSLISGILVMIIGHDHRAHYYGLYTVYLHDRIPGLRSERYASGGAGEAAEKNTHRSGEYRSAESCDIDRMAARRPGRNRHADLRFLYRSYHAACFPVKELLRINLYILLVWFSDLIVRKPRRTPVRLRFLP